MQKWHKMRLFVVAWAGFGPLLFQTANKAVYGRQQSSFSGFFFLAVFLAGLSIIASETEHI